MPENAVPVADLRLAKEPHLDTTVCRRAPLAMPIVDGAKASPHSQSEAAGQMRQCRVGRDHQVEVGHDRGRLHQVTAPPPRQIDHRETSVSGFELIQAMLGLEADQLNARQLGQRCEMSQAER